MALAVGRRKLWAVLKAGMKTSIEHKEEELLSRWETAGLLKLLLHLANWFINYDRCLQTSLNVIYGAADRPVAANSSYKFFYSWWIFRN